MTAIRLQTILCLLTFAAAAIGFSNWFLKPEAGAVWIIGSLSVPVLWAIVAFMEQRRPLSDYSISEKNIFTVSVLSAAAMLVVAQGVHLIEFLGVSASDAIDRVWGVCVGAVLVGIGNATPKVLPPLNKRQCSLQNSHAVQRFAGWALVLGGAGYALSWLMLPVESAGFAATASCLGAVIAIAWRCAVAGVQRSRTPQIDG